MAILLHFCYTKLQICCLKRVVFSFILIFEGDMKMKKLILLTVILCFTLCGCAKQTAPVSAPESKPESKPESTEPISSAPEIEIEGLFPELIGILKGESFTTAKGEIYNIYNFSIADWKFNPDQYAFADMDGDGENELAVSDADCGDFLVFNRDESGKVGGYLVPYRGFRHLKKDGRFYGSSSAADCDISKMVFNNVKSHLPVSYSSLCEMHDIEERYLINDEPVTKGEAEKYFEEFSKAEDAEWTSLVKLY